MLDTSGARDKVLLLGLVDWVPLERVHHEVAQANREARLQDVQRQTLDLIDTLVGEGLFVIGNLIDNGSRFEPWETLLSASIQRLREVYADGFNDPDTWQWFCWLDLTAKGEDIALPLEKSLNSGGSGI
ncbi:hypothetical protein BH09ACT8_BH09ACT8_25710 [soil metagenome]